MSVEKCVLYARDDLAGTRGDSPFHSTAWDTIHLQALRLECIHAYSREKPSWHTPPAGALREGDRLDIAVLPSNPSRETDYLLVHDVMTHAPTPHTAAIGAAVQKSCRRRVHLGESGHIVEEAVLATRVRHSEETESFGTGKKQLRTHSAGFGRQKEQQLGGGQLNLRMSSRRQQVRQEERAFLQETLPEYERRVELDNAHRLFRLRLPFVVPEPSLHLMTFEPSWNHSNVTRCVYDSGVEYIPPLHHDVEGYTGPAYSMRNHCHFRYQPFLNFSNSTATCSRMNIHVPPGFVRRSANPVPGAAAAAAPILTSLDATLTPVVSPTETFSLWKQSSCNRNARRMSALSST